MATPRRDPKISYTTFSNSKNKNSKKPFHKPEAYGELIKIPSTVPMKVISVISIIVQALLTALAIYAIVTTDTIAALEGSGFATSMIYIIFPIVTWILTFGFRFMIRYLPVEMWRLPAKVKKAVVFCEGKPLKLGTLLIELEVAILFLFITLILLAGGTPSIPLLIVFIAVLALSIYLPGRRAVREMDAQKADK